CWSRTWSSTCSTARSTRGCSVPEPALTGLGSRRRSRRLFAAGVVLVGALALVALAAPWLTAYDPDAIVVTSYHGPLGPGGAPPPDRARDHLPALHPHHPARHRGDRLDNLRAHGAGRRAEPARARLRAGGACPRRLRRAHHPPPSPARGAAGRGGARRVTHVGRDRGGRGALVPGPRRAAADAVLGAHGERRADLHRRRPLAGGGAGRGD